jgi:hypothetical protein
MNWSDTGAVVRTVAPVVQIGLIIAGWYYISRDHNRREERKELRALIAEWKRQVQILRERGIEYYQLPGSDQRAPQLARELKYGLKALCQQIQQYTNFCPSFDAADELVALRQAFTGGEFESINRAALPLESDVLNSMANAEVKLATQFELLFMKIYLPAQK